MVKNSPEFTWVKLSIKESSFFEKKKNCLTSKFDFKGLSSTSV